MSNIDARGRVIVALDLPSVEDAGYCVSKLGSSVTFYKIGLELICGGGGVMFAERLIGQGYSVFIDLKLHDIPNTVERSVRQISEIGASFLTVHAYPQTMRAAVAGAAGTNLKLLGVTALTSADDNDLAEAGYKMGVRALVSQRAIQAEIAGLQGIVASPQEASLLRSEGRRLTIVCPGIRPAGSDLGDQKRSSTASAAILDGADFVVVGRPITRAVDPRAAAEAIILEIAEALPGIR